MATRAQRISMLFATQSREFRRDFGAVFFSFVFPGFFVVALAVTSLVTPQFQFNVGVVDPHDNPSAHSLVEAVASSHLAVRTMPLEQARHELSTGDLQAVLVLPADDLVAGHGEIELQAEARYQDFVRMVLDAGRAKLLAQQDGAATGYRIRVTSPPEVVGSEFSFIYPGMLALALLQLGLFATATPLLRARERGTIRHLLLTPLAVGELLAAQVGFRFLIALIQVLLLLVAGSFVIDLSLTQWLAILAVSCLGAVMLISIGYALAGLAPNLEGGLAMIMMINFAMMFAGNIFTDPGDSTVLLVLAHMMPVSYLADLYRQVISGADGMWPAWADIAAMGAWATAALLVAVRTFRFDMSAVDQRRQVQPA